MIAILTGLGSVLLALVLLVVVMVVLGARLPVAHVAARRARIPARADDVFARIEDVERAASWRADVKKVEIVRREPLLRWRESGQHGDIEYERDVLERPSRIVTRIASEGLPFGGRWTYALAPDGDATIVTITEEGEVRPPLFRFLSQHVFGHTSTIDGVLRALARSFGGDAAPEDPPRGRAR